MAAAEFDYDFEANKIGKAVDRKEWNMTPQTVNAYNNPLWNEIVFPAGILQPPFFHKDFPAAMNYGGIGGVIGHELTHGYDDQGRKFDPTGRMQEWWEPEVAGNFESQAQCIDDFYADYEVEPGVAVNGRLTLGENIADIGGLKQAHAAYKLWEQRHGSPDPPVEGLTNEQLLFVSWGQVWCTKMSPEIARLLVTTDSHSPAQFRVSGPVSHNPAFAEAFQCETGTPMRPEETCLVW
jgi:endothelin-converting enzyme/putative endopeptidase